MSDKANAAIDGLNWDDALSSRTVTLPSDELDRAIKFLEEARHDGAWGIYPSTQVDRHSSAIAVAALRTAMDHWLIRDCTILFVNKYRDQIPGLGVDALVDVIELVKDAFDEQPDLKKSMSRRVKEQLRHLTTDENMGGASRLASLLATATAAGLIKEKEAELGWKTLIKSQHKDGSWSAVSEQGGSLTATAAALSALNQVGAECASGIRQGAFDYLVAQFARLEGEEESPELFAIATTLLAIVSHPACDYWLVSRLQDMLLDRQNNDGGWSEQPDSPSTVEHTGLAVLALTAAGARSHVPTRLAQAALAQARGMLGDVGRERDRLQAGFDEAVREHCGSLATETKRLKAELNSAQKALGRISELEADNRRLRRVAEPLAYSSELLAGSPLRTPEYVAVVSAWTSVGGVVVLAGLLVAGVLSTTPATLALLVGVSVTASAFSLLVAETRRRRTQRLLWDMHGFAEQSHLQWTPFEDEPVGERLRALRVSFSGVLNECSPSIQTELVYMLFDGFTEVPADVAGRRAEQVAMRFGMTPEGAVRFKQWASTAALLEPRERRLLFDQIRRSIDL
ncbi:MAG: prenyltransferase/squalene oxidase repeat-containing protein [Chloroflexota bacterium]